MYYLVYYKTNTSLLRNFSKFSRIAACTFKGCTNISHHLPKLFKDMLETSIYANSIGLSVSLPDMEHIPQSPMQDTKCPIFFLT